EQAVSRLPRVHRLALDHDGIRHARRRRDPAVALPLPFMLMPVAVTLWYMSMDIVPFLFGADRVYDWEIRKFISLWFGLAMVLVAFWVDLRSRLSRDYAFWLYLFGVLAFWGGLSLMKSGSELGKLGYCGINVAMILLGAVIGRRVFAVFGGLGVAGY